MPTMAITTRAKGAIASTSRGWDCIHTAKTPSRHATTRMASDLDLEGRFSQTVQPSSAQEVAQAIKMSAPPSAVSQLSRS
jgi:hypothetical protein